MNWGKSIIFVFLGMAMMQNTAHAEKKLEKATFAGGCFWCMQPPYDKLKGVHRVVAGYTGGKKENPTYAEVSSGHTGHREAVEVTFDPQETTYKELLDVFWKQIDPTDNAGQFADEGSQYRTAIFYHNDEQRRAAESSKKELEASRKFSKPIATEILEAAVFYKAEDYHQNYYKKSPVQYETYKTMSGRAGFIEKTWGKDKAVTGMKYVKPPSDAIKKKLTPMEYKVTQTCGTEPPFNNKYWNNKEEGIYVDIVSGEPLFSSMDKFDSGTGWPSFTKPIDMANIEKKKDNTLSAERIEIRSKYGDSHLGHVFNDGPGPDGQRYCINSSSLRFIPKEKLEEEGYGEYKKLFEEGK